MRTARSLLALLLLAPAAAADDCDYCKPRKVCSVHAEEDAAALAALRDRLDAADPAVRRAAYEEAAALTLGHENAPSEEVAELLAEGLEDDDLDVRARAAELLARGQHPDVAAKALVGTLADVRKVLDRADDDAPLPPGVAAYAGRVLAALGELPDDRAAEALLGFLRATERRPWADAVAAPGAAALAALGRADGVAWAVERLASLAPEERVAVRDTLAARAAALEAPAPPAADAAPEAWAAWLEAAEERLPARLGKLRLG